MDGGSDAEEAMRSGRRKRRRAGAGGCRRDGVPSAEDAGSE